MRRQDSDDHLLSDCRSSMAFSQARPPPAFPGKMRTPPRERPASAGPAKHAATGDLWCCLVLGFIAFCSYGILSVPAHDRTLSSFEAKVHDKVHFIVRALGGELEKENNRLSSTLDTERKKEVNLQNEEEVLRKQLADAHHKEEELQRSLVVKDSSYKSAQQDIVRTRTGLETWHKKSAALETKLSLVQKDATKKQMDLQRTHKQASKAEEHARQLESALNAARKKISSMEVAARRLRGQLQHEENWHQETVTKIRRYRDAEQNLMKSMDLDSDDPEATDASN